MKIFVTGISGQLGYDVLKEAKKRGIDIVGTSSKELDITDEQAVKNCIASVKPNVIIHCAAYTAVDKAEEDRDTCYNVNVNGTKYLAEAAAKHHAKFVYISTDYVFDGQGNQPFKETDKTNPIGYYGETKLQGEKVVQQLLEKYFIVRISWVFGKNGHNFVKTMLRLAESYETVSVVGDQLGSPTYTVDLAKVLLDMVQTERYGIYHASNEGFCSWAQFAEAIFNEAGKATAVKAITTAEYPTKAKRPANSKMDKSKLAEVFSALPTWQDALSRYLKELQ
ncbi:dTDP-4-dehydrorhamnose reductase [Metasolibacillus sp. FSL H7-0170]|uniref:dTDP-4-dehydrorhamnose reductase n=1 Tax=Metasolibacillus sp. FSL H7-0170 TaxID=2921431 RepID=UPI003158B44C